MMNPRLKVGSKRHVARAGSLSSVGKGEVI